MKLTNEWRAVIFMFGIGLILQIWGYGTYAGAGMLGAGIFDAIKIGLDEWDKIKKKENKK